MGTSTSSKGGSGGSCISPYASPIQFQNPYIAPPWQYYIPHYPFVTIPYPDWVIDQLQNDWWNAVNSVPQPGNPGGVPPVRQRSLSVNTAIDPNELKLAKIYCNFWQIGSVGTDQEKVDLIRWWKSEVFQPLNKPFKGFFGPLFDRDKDLRKTLKGFWFQPTRLKVEICTFRNDGRLDVKWRKRNVAPPPVEPVIPFVS